MAHWNKEINEFTIKKVNYQNDSIRVLHECGLSLKKKRLDNVPHSVLLPSTYPLLGSPPESRYSE